jgi:hypothetical protein
MWSGSLSGGKAEAWFAPSSVGAEVRLVRAEFVGCSIGPGDGDFAGVAVEVDAPLSFVDSGMMPTTQT